MFIRSRLIEHCVQYSFCIRSNHLRFATLISYNGMLSLVSGNISGCVLLNWDGVRNHLKTLSSLLIMFFITINKQSYVHVNSKDATACTTTRKKGVGTMCEQK